MHLQHIIFAALAATYCLVLGFFSLLQGRSKVNRLFFAYNVCNALWNSGDIVHFFDGGTGRLEWMLRFLGLGGCLFIPFVVHFGYEVINVDRGWKRRVLFWLYLIGILFCVLHQTPLLHTTALYGYSDVSGFWSKPGPLFPVFALYLLAGLVLLSWPLPRALRQEQGLRKKQAAYLTLSCILGFVAMSSFFLSFLSFDWPWLYYGLQSLVGFVFAYAIFAHHLIHLSVALRRAALLAGIYVLLAVVTVPLAVLFHAHVVAGGTMSVGAFLTFLGAFGLVVSLGPVIYANLVRRSILFHEESVWKLTHEFKTPLATIQSAKEILEQEISKGSLDDAKVAAYMQMIEMNTARLGRFVQDILDFGKAETNGRFDQKRALRLSDVVQETVRLFPKEMSRIEFGEENGTNVFGFEEGIRQILSNLISNAVRYSAAGPIRIFAKRLNNHIEVSVADRGVGIGPEDIETIFRPFHRLPGSTKGGSGLGLAIAKTWVEAHDGKIWAESDGLGKGTTVTFTLPVSRSA